MLDSKAVEDKLYSAESSSSAREDEEEDSSLGPGANARGHNGNHNDKSQTFLSQLANQLQV